jgi:hypothetical protein
VELTASLLSILGLCIRIRSRADGDDGDGEDGHGAGW